MCDTAYMCKWVYTTIDNKYSMLFPAICTITCTISYTYIYTITYTPTHTSTHLHTH